MSWTTPHNEERKRCKFIETIRDCYLYQHLQEPTHTSGNDGPSLIDLVLTDEVMQVSNTAYHALLGRSDHSVITFKLNSSFMKKADFETMQQHILMAKTWI